MPEKLSPVYCKLILSIICYSQEHLVTYETTHDLVKRIGLEESREKKQDMVINGPRAITHRLLINAKYVIVPFP